MLSSWHNVPQGRIVCATKWLPLLQLPDGDQDIANPLRYDTTTNWQTPHNQNIVGKVARKLCYSPTPFLHYPRICNIDWIQNKKCPSHVKAPSWFWGKTHERVATKSTNCQELDNSSSNTTTSVNVWTRSSDMNIAPDINNHLRSLDLFRSMII